ncbi:MAG: hypothetical protein QOH97_1311 [Actinoplanes sp.]|jgi:hypothetical protein|nr:hypothetical protein [Actinoplanes sp.]
MAAKTYWLTDGADTKALVDGDAERDRWIPLGWFVSDAPVEGEWVWLQHAVTGGKQRFPAVAAPLWAPRGWTPSSPPEPENLYKDPQPSDDTPTAADKTTTAAAASGKNKE